MKSWLWISGATIAVVTAAVLTTAALPTSTGREDADRVMPVARQDLQAQVTVAGAIVPQRRILFVPPYNGYVHKIHVKLGDMVPAGAPILSLTQSLRGVGEEVFPMRAPFSGRVTQILRQEGEYVETGKENNGIVRIDDRSRMFVYSDIPEADIGRMSLGQDVRVRANAILEREYHGKIRQIFLSAKEKKDWSRNGDRVEFEVRIEITDADEQLRSGMSSIVDVITAAKKGVLTLPHEYVQRGTDRDDGKYFVNLEGGGRREVKVGLQNEESVEILDGVKEGERVRMVDFFTLPKRT